jgi:cytochrome c55X
VSRRASCIGFATPALLVALAAHAGGPDAARQAELLHLVRQDCGSCHGMTLRGSLGPPLTPAALSERSEEAIVATIVYGRRGTAMPPWAPFLTEPEARWIAVRLKQGLEQDAR